MKKMILLSFLGLGLFGFGIISGGVLFSDVKVEDWFYNDVMNLVDNGIIKGHGDGTFKPHEQVTRAQLSTILNRSNTVQNLEVQKKSDLAMNGLVLTAVTNVDLYKRLAFTFYTGGEFNRSSSGCSIVDGYYEMAENQLVLAKLFNSFIINEDYITDLSQVESALSTNKKDQFLQCNF